ncbi:electron transport complex protein RnfE [Chitinivorax tropicus]|uniref:Ion-translocating oxidoreductase complex subunit E n=1 Tax=Chitinivorax tropicus TaxID=714531 RepID=A0A840MNZ2_9PROT|nr:electron transport complex subunit E [Chitinivorax tropicus]MBB5019185.1 electron transport complex protein RnfE [Chitinivorax tropicus]
MSDKSLSDICQDGLWRQNPGLVQLLGLCPLLAVSTTVVNGASLGLATALAMATSSAAVSLIRHWVPHEIRIPVFVLIIAALVTVIQLLMQAYLPALYSILGLFVALITTNCIVLARAEAFAAKHRVLPSMVDGLMMGLGLTGVLMVLGGLRELLGQGTLFAGMDLIVGTELGQRWMWRVLPDAYPGFLLAMLPPGAFMGLGLIIAARNAWMARSTHQPDSQVPATSPSTQA